MGDDIIKSMVPRVYFSSRMNYAIHYHLVTSIITPKIIDKDVVIFHAVQARLRESLNREKGSKRKRKKKQVVPADVAVELKVEKEKREAAKKKEHKNKIHIF
ncbi:unnamed protein product [Arabidopsis lyrata]|uniref:Predicted protein n=1 Tax=Arabidopsis lyrata subsp. lyrata TaxID=81972 RepID=D7KPP5_ARALL|nr:predicted protein [Arabidopsis lyrata subsp. lyrata]CAH8253470.1 unnamed protein product [Arabidopsis lyrata]